MATIALLLGLCLIWVAAVHALPAAAAELRASLDRTRIGEGETVTLTLIAPGDVWGTPDPTPLTADFDVVDQQQSTRMSIVNGQSSSTREWRYLLAPKRQGVLPVPPIEVGNLVSPALTVEVLPAGQADPAGEGLPVILEAEAGAAPYVQGQVVYRVRLLYRVPLRQATLSDPKAAGAIVERLGDDVRSEIYRGGQRYQVVERRYAVFPQHSGPLDIEAPVLSASVPERDGRRGGLRDGTPGFADDFERLLGRDPFADMGGLFERTRPVRVRGPAVSLDVRPRPDGASTPWLPAESLSLSETWAPQDGPLRAGEPATRTIVITAQGLTAAQLPDLVAPVPDGMRAYPDKPRSESRAEGDSLVSMKVIRQALVPARDGKFTLPEVRLPWWDVTEERERVAVLPERVVEVLPAAPGTPAAAPAAAAPQRADAAPLPDAGARTRPQAPAAPPPRPAVPAAAEASPAAGWWPWLSVLLGAAWALTLTLWLRERRRPAAGAAAPARGAHPVRLGRREALSGVRLACAAGDARGARRALIDWGAACWPERPPRGLPELAQRFDGAPRDAVHALDRHLYGAGAELWDGRRAWTALEPALSAASDRQQRPRRPVGMLPELYPQRG